MRNKNQDDYLLMRRICYLVEIISNVPVCSVWISSVTHSALSFARSSLEIDVCTMAHQFLQSDFIETVICYYKRDTNRPLTNTHGVAF